MRILLVDDHGLFAEGLQNLLQAGGYEVVGIAYDGLEALHYARSLHPDLILMDIRMPNCDGLEATRLIKEEMPKVQIVMLTTSAEDVDLFEAVKNGACGYLLKNLKPNELFNYLASLAQGEAPLSRELSRSLMREFAHQAAVIEEHRRWIEPHTADQKCLKEVCLSEIQPGPELTFRQHEILNMIAAGLSYKEVGAALHVSKNTVRYHMGEIFKRLNVKNREQVVAYAFRTGLIQQNG